MLTSLIDYFNSVWVWFFGNYVTTIPLLSNLIIPLLNISFSLWFIWLLLFQPIIFVFKNIGNKLK